MDTITFSHNIRISTNIPNTSKTPTERNQINTAMPNRLNSNTGNARQKADSVEMLWERLLQNEKQQKSQQQKQMERLIVPVEDASSKERPAVRGKCSWLFKTLKNIFKFVFGFSMSPLTGRP